MWNTTNCVSLFLDPDITINVTETEQDQWSFKVGCTIDHSAGPPNITLQINDNDEPLLLSTMHENKDQFTGYAYIPVSKSVELSCTVSDSKGTYNRNRYLLMSGRTTSLFSVILNLYLCFGNILPDVLVRVVCTLQLQTPF